MRDFTVDDFVKLKNLEYKIKMNEKRKTEEIVRDVDVVMRDNIEDIITLSFDEFIERTIQEYFKNNKGRKGE